MIYKNIKTGALVTSPCTISGDDWVLLSDNDKDKVTETTDEPKKPVRKPKK